ncbi:MAG: hypothetical protein PF440_05755 [Thiomicrorhabdus sp.]|jgi:hypothetical protein|nr:hypothetical protein [Thiomicrorhabdus sp.]
MFHKADMKPIYANHIWLARLTCVMFLILFPVMLPVAILVELKKELKSIIRIYFKEAWIGIFGTYE